jgi:hypothetical protein
VSFGRTRIRRSPEAHGETIRIIEVFLSTGTIMFSLRNPFFSWATPLLLVALAGCGDSGPTIVKVAGVLTHQSQPVTNATVDFTPENGRPSWGQTDEQGRFKLHYDPERDGAVTGKHKISIRPKPTTVKEQEAVMMGKKMPMSKQMAEFFDKYSQEKTKFEFTIDKNSTDIKLEMP